MRELSQQWLLMTLRRLNYETGGSLIQDPAHTWSTQRHGMTGRRQAITLIVELLMLAIAVFSSQLGARWNLLLVRHMWTIVLQT
jgi:hypothetical protein